MCRESHLKYRGDNKNDWCDIFPESWNDTRSECSFLIVNICSSFKMVPCYQVRNLKSVPLNNVLWLIYSWNIFCIGRIFFSNKICINNCLRIEMIFQMQALQVNPYLGEKKHSRLSPNIIARRWMQKKITNGSELDFPICYAKRMLTKWKSFLVT